MTNRNLKYAAGLTILIVAFIGSEYAKHKFMEKDVLLAPVLQENEKQKIIIDTNKKKLTVVKRGPLARGKDDKTGRTQVVKVTEGARKVVITELEDGTIQVTAINKGFCFEPGLALYYSDSPRLGVDIQWAYYKRWGALLGAGVNMGDEPRTVRAHVAVTYALPLDFVDNTSVFLGMDHKQDAVLGIRIRF